MSESNHHQDVQAIADGGPPPAPLDVPQYVRDGIGNQDPELLREIAVWCEELADYHEQRPIEVDDDEELVEVNEDGGDDESDGTQVIKKVPCGKECSGCPHGPYEYRVKRVGKTLDWEYIGRADL